MIKVTVYNEHNRKAWSAAFYDNAECSAVWLDYCMIELRLHIIQGFTITRTEV